MEFPKGKAYWVDQPDVYDSKECILFFNADSANDAIYMRIADEELGVFVDYGNNGDLDNFWFTNLKRNTDTKYEKNSKDKAKAETFRKANGIYKSFRKFFEPYLQKVKK